MNNFQALQPKHIWQNKNIPSSNDMAPAKTKAEYSPTSYPAADMQFAIACM